MTKLGFVIIAAALLQLATNHCQASSSSEFKKSPIKSSLRLKKQTAFNPEEHFLRRRRQLDTSGMNSDTAATVLSILPLDRIGTIVGQIMGTGLKEMFNPDVGKKLINVIENQAPLLLTSLFTNLYSNLRVPVRPSTNSTSSSISLTNNGVKQLSNATNSEILNAIRRPGAK